MKFFPAVQFGGVSTIQALTAPYVGLKFMPTGGVNAKNLADYLQCKSIIACGGSWMVKSQYIHEHRFDKITRLTRQAVELVREIRRKRS